MDNSAAIAESIMGGFAKPIPLISFYSIIDEDMALIKYIILEMRNEEVFNLDKVKNMKYLEIVGELYRRKYDNPLYFLMKDEKYKSFLDDCYREFVNDKEAEILKHAITTEMYNLMLEFNKSGEVIPQILYYSQAQKDLLDSIKEISDLRKISLKEFEKSKHNNFTQYYFKYIGEANESFLASYDKSFYFSSCGINLTEDNNDILIDYQLARKLASHRNNIAMYDMYRMNLIGNYEEPENII